MANRHGHRTRTAKRDHRPRRVTPGLRRRVTPGLRRRVKPGLRRRVTPERHLEMPVVLELAQAVHPTVDLPVNHPETHLVQNLRRASVLRALDTSAHRAVGLNR